MYQNNRKEKKKKVRQKTCRTGKMTMHCDDSEPPHSISILPIESTYFLLSGETR